MPTGRTESLIHRLFDEAFNQGQIALVDELLSPNHFTHTAFGGAPHGPQGLKWLIVMFRTAFPDLHCTIEDEIREGDKVAACWLMRGTHQGLFLGNPPTFRQVKIQGIVFARTAHGQIVEDWILADQMDILQQLGIVPPPPGH